MPKGKNLQTAESTEFIKGHEQRNEDSVLQLIEHNIQVLKREKSLGTKVDAASIREFEDEYHSLRIARDRKRSGISGGS